MCITIFLYPDLEDRVTRFVTVYMAILVRGHMFVCVRLLETSLQDRVPKII